MHEGSCHCGAVRLTLPSTPTVATRCNCSLCRRIGGPWVYFEFGTVRITGHPESTTDYVQGDRTLRTVRCRTCGCVTHWEPLQGEPGARHGVNLGNFDPALIASVRVRRFDGADTWQFLPEPAEAARELVVTFFNAIAQRDEATIRRLGRPDYIQHNPDFETGIDGLIRTLRSRTTPAATQPLEFVRVLVDGDFVMTLRRAPPLPERAAEPGAEMGIVDVFRVEGGRVAEHWDYKEHFPRGSQPPRNSNGRF